VAQHHSMKIGSVNENRKEEKKKKKKEASLILKN
jgi:hypothetical protein